MPSRQLLLQPQRNYVTTTAAKISKNHENISSSNVHVSVNRSEMITICGADNIVTRMCGQLERGERCGDKNLFMPTEKSTRLCSVKPELPSNEVSNRARRTVTRSYDRKPTLTSGEMPHQLTCVQTNWRVS